MESSSNHLWSDFEIYYAGDNQHEIWYLGSLLIARIPPSPSQKKKIRLSDWIRNLSISVQIQWNLSLYICLSFLFHLIKSDLWPNPMETTLYCVDSWLNNKCNYCIAFNSFSNPCYSLYFLDSQNFLLIHSNLDDQTEPKWKSPLEKVIFTVSPEIARFLRKRRGFGLETMNDVLTKISCWLESSYKGLSVSVTQAQILNSRYDPGCHFRQRHQRNRFSNIWSTTRKWQTL